MAARSLTIMLSRMSILWANRFFLQTRVEEGMGSQQEFALGCFRSPVSSAPRRIVPCLLSSFELGISELDFILPILLCDQKELMTLEITVKMLVSDWSRSPFPVITSKESVDLKNEYLHSCFGALMFNNICSFLQLQKLPKCTCGLIYNLHLFFCYCFIISLPTEIDIHLSFCITCSFL